jgi:hypothetical protein
MLRGGRWYAARRALVCCAAGASNGVFRTAARVTVYTGAGAVLIALGVSVMEYGIRYGRGLVSGLMESIGVMGHGLRLDGRGWLVKCYLQMFWSIARDVWRWRSGCALRVRLALWYAARAARVARLWRCAGHSGAGWYRIRARAALALWSRSNPTRKNASPL